MYRYIFKWLTKGLSIYCPELARNFNCLFNATQTHTHTSKHINIYTSCSCFLPSFIFWLLALMVRLLVCWFVGLFVCLSVCFRTGLMCAQRLASLWLLHIHIYKRNVHICILLRTKNGKRKV